MFRCCGWRAVAVFRIIDAPTNIQVVAIAAGLVVHTAAGLQTAIIVAFKLARREHGARHGKIRRVPHRREPAARRDQAVDAAAATAIIISLVAAIG